MYFFNKAIEYFFPIINKTLLKEAMKKLSEEEKNIFFQMSEYDKVHSLEVYKKIRKTDLKTSEIYLKLALLHDCGKENINLFTRVLRKIGIKTKLENHPEIGYEKMKKINSDLAELIKNHHTKNYSEQMNIFQKCDDES